MKYYDFEELPIWKNTREIVKKVYLIIEVDTKLEKDFRLTGQLIGASLSIMNNIAEGFDSGSNTEFIRFLKYSQRSCSEIMSMTYVLKDVYKIETAADDLYNAVLDERKQIKGLVKYLKNSKPLIKG